MRLQGILNRYMYKDKATVYRLASATADDGSDDYSDEEQEIYKDIPCKLSQYGKELTVTKTAQAAEVKNDLRLCCAPEIDIKAEDRLIVEHEGQIFTLYASTKFSYPTHAEISVFRTKEAGSDGD